MRTASTANAVLALGLCTAAANARAIIHRDIAARNVLILRASEAGQPSVNGTAEVDYGEFGVDISVEPATGRWSGAYADGQNPSAAAGENPLYQGSGSQGKNPLFEQNAVFSSTIGAISGAAIQIDTGSAFSNTMGSAFQFDWIVNGQTYTYIIPAIEAWAVVTTGPWINGETVWTLGSDLPLTPIGIALELNTSVTLIAGSTLTLTPVPTPGTAILALAGLGLTGRRRRSST